MSRDRVTLIQAVDSGNDLSVNIPPGEYYVGDPCYVLSDDLYRELGALIFPPDDSLGGGRDIHVVVELKNGTKGVIVDWRTAHGDGRYDVVAAKGFDTVCVDSGGLAMIDRRLMAAKKYDEETLLRIAHFETVKEPTALRVEGGDARLEGFFTLCTEDRSPEDYE
jgi:hypothetical protein